MHEKSTAFNVRGYWPRVVASGAMLLATDVLSPYLNFKTASTIATSIVHSKLDYCNSLYYNLPKSQTNRLQVIQNSLARAVVKAPKFCHVTPILKSLHWLKINERIEYTASEVTTEGGIEM